MHSTKTQTDGSIIFNRLQAQLRRQHPASLPAAARQTEVLWTQLDQLSGARMAQFHRSLTARFGTAPWKHRDSRDEDAVSLLTADGLRDAWLRSLESALRQSLRRELADILPQRRGREASAGQAIADAAQLLTRMAGRNS